MAGSTLLPALSQVLLLALPSPQTDRARAVASACRVGRASSHEFSEDFAPLLAQVRIDHDLSQVQRATELAVEQGVPNANFQVMNALDMTFEDDSFDIVWACESGEHMPDKRKYVEEMTRVLKPGG